MPAPAFCVWTFSLALFVAAPPPKPPETVTLRGKVLMLTEALEARSWGSRPIPTRRPSKPSFWLTMEPSPRCLRMQTSRACSWMSVCADRNARVIGRRHPGLPYLQVVTIEVESDGKLRTPEYFCDVCTISVYYPQICPCCQGPMVLRMKPDPG